MFKNRILLITGGTGSFGNAVLNRFLNTDISEIRIFSRDELKQDEMRKRYNINKLKFYIGDVRNLQSLKNAIAGVDYIFHAAALKQVPSCEFFPIEAVYTNIIGTDNVLTAAIEARVKKVICLSTDKAAYPVNAMGMSKAMMEKVFIAKSRALPDNSTIICGTRYGNVMCSRGSVIPLFIEQIKKGNNITVTDPNMTRFMMSLDEAINLILFTFKNSANGDLMVQKSDACYVGDLAEALRDLFGVDNKIDIIGTRHGEKEYEVLLTKEESARAIEMGNFFRVPADNRDLNYALYLEKGAKEFSASVEYNSKNTKIMTVDEIKAKLSSLKFIQSELKSWNIR